MARGKCRCHHCAPRSVPLVDGADEDGRNRCSVWSQRKQYTAGAMKREGGKGRGEEKQRRRDGGEGKRLLVNKLCVGVWVHAHACNKEKVNVHVSSRLRHSNKRPSCSTLNNQTVVDVGRVRAVLMCDVLCSQPPLPLLLLLPLTQKICICRFSVRPTCKERWQHNVGKSQDSNLVGKFHAWHV